MNIFTLQQKLIKRSFLSACVVLGLGVTGVQAQTKWDVGLSAGGNVNTLYTTAGGRSYTEYTSVPGFQFAVPVQYHVNDWLAVQSEVSYIQKAYALTRTGIFEGLEIGTRNSYLQVPLMAKFSYGGERLRGYTSLGAFAGYWLKSRLNGNVPGTGLPEEDESQTFEFDEVRPFNSQIDRRFEFGLAGGLGLEYKLNQRYKIFGEARYYYSLTDLQKNYMLNQTPKYNNTHGVQVGVLYRIGK